jgi:hypothetical protein
VTLETEIKKQSNGWNFCVTVRYQLGLETKENYFESEIYSDQASARQGVDKFLERLAQDPYILYSEK